MGSRGSSSGNIKEPTSYRGPGEFGEQFARLNPRLSPEKAASMAVDRWIAKEGGMTSDSDIDGVYDAAYSFAADKNGMSNVEKRGKISENLNTPQLNNKNNIINFVKKQTNVDLSKLVEPKAGRSRTYLGVHLEDLNRNQRNAVTGILNKMGVRVESNGGYGDAIYYKK